ncbi:FAD-binding oxidoreductase [Paenibacillus sp. MER TA 81-3]|uniref:FAD-binding oxidoreductase n=1 Tax=Paenibacillus sp. MER TA 81-3 TaxID=2939573 RepID=UPI00204149BA|nr:FAD-binding oxidoreductase [Paenibacillus sp. MER TA 81-3]MCM3340708.1 FAD-binding oxidoreductase [Paenibacillus sp. MER TA 81-3]
MELLEKIKKVLDSDRIITEKNQLILYSKDATSYHEAKVPELVVFPTNKSEVSALVSIANESGVTIIPYGLGTSVEGQIVPLKRSITLDFKLMNKIIEFRPEDNLIRVQPGVKRRALNDFLQEYKLFFPIDPGVDATIGGMAATNASGSNGLYYGSMKNNITGLEVVLANGDIIQTGGKTLKSSSGYNLTNLFVGSEGTLGIFTELTLKISPLNKHSKSLLVSFGDEAEAVKTALDILGCGLNIRKLEIVDCNAIEVINSYNGTKLTLSPSLMIEIGGIDQLIISREFQLLLENLGRVVPFDNILTYEFEKSEELWSLRRGIALALKSYYKKNVLVTDISVPLSKLPLVFKETRIIMDTHNIDGVLIGHVGDGNFHAALVVNDKDTQELAKVKHINDLIIDLAIKNNGTISGEHGIGIGKREHLVLEHGASVEYMKKIKNLFDPNNILNSGKIFLK